MIPSGTRFVAINTDDKLNRVWTIDEISLFPSGSSSVPYTGATGNVDLGEYGLTAGFAEFDTTPTGTPTTQGTLSWDVDHNTLQLVMNGTTGRVMEDVLYIVKNQTGSTIPKGTVVRADGTLGSSGRILVEPFIANGTLPSDYVMGVTAEAILDGADGMVMHFGQIKNFNTSGYTDGDILYASTTVAGGFTTTVPSAPNNIIQVAIVIHAHTNGIIQVRPTIGSNINKDEGVAISTPTDGQVLTYDSATSLWKNTTPTGGGVSDGDKGDITVSSSGAVWNIDAATVGVTELSATGTPSATTFLRGDNTWAVPASADPAGWTVIVKSANQDVTNSATLVSDTDLQFSVVAGGHYMIELDIVFSSNSTSADYKNAFNVSAGTMLGTAFMIGPTATSAAQVNTYSANTVATSTSLVLGSTIANLSYLVSTKIIFSFQASANATFRYQFAQNSAVPATTARTWKGSILKYKRID